MEKIIYKEKYQELMNNFENVIKNNIPFSHIKTNYNGWSDLLNRLKKEDCKEIEYGNLSYFISVNFKFSNGNFEKANIVLTDDSADEKYTDDYCFIKIYYKNGVLKKDFVKEKELNRDNDCECVWFTCDFYYFYDCFLVFCRCDMDELYYLFCFGDNSKLDLLLKDTKLDKIKSNIVADMSYIFSEKVFQWEDNTEIFEQIGTTIIDAIKNNQLNKISDYFENDLIYTSGNIYGFEKTNNIQELFSEIVNSKDIIEMKIFHGICCDNGVEIFAKMRQEDGKIKNKIIYLKINHNHKIYYIEDVMTLLYGIPEFE